MPREFTNAQGLFLGMIVAIVSMEIYCRLADSGKLAIKMPESVPSNVSSAFNALFPAVPVSYTHLDVYKRQVFIGG